jgi:hypothetical protein
MMAVTDESLHLVILKLDMDVVHKLITNSVCRSQWLRTWKQFEALRLCPKVGKKYIYILHNTFSCNENNCY